MHRTVSFMVISTVLALGLLAAPASGQRGACRADVDKFCKDVNPGSGRVMACLGAHRDRLSDACKQHLATVQATAGACKGDVQKICKGVQGGRRVRKCLEGHTSELSADCKSALAKAPH